MRRYGQIIGFATRPIAPGDHVHTQNLAVGDMTLDYQFGTDLRPVEYVPEAERRTFLGYRRADGRAGTRSRDRASVMPVNDGPTTKLQPQPCRGHLHRTRWHVNQD